MRNFTYEIFFGKPDLNEKDWQKFCEQILYYSNRISSLRILVRLKQSTLHYFLCLESPLASAIGLENFLLKPTKISGLGEYKTGGILLNRWRDNLADLMIKLQQKQQKFLQLELQIYGTRTGKHFEIAKIFYAKSDMISAKRLALCSMPTLLNINHNNYPNFGYKKAPKYLSAEKVLPLLSKDPTQAVLKVDTFPFSDGVSFLKPAVYDLAKHSLILGASGSGKSRFVSLLVDQISRQHSNTKIIIIDPHDALFRELSAVKQQAVINFASPTQSIDLFKNAVQNISVNVELLLQLFESLMKTNYNHRLERVLRFSCHLLLFDHSFSFQSLRQLLFDAEFRNSLISRTRNGLPPNVAAFFLTDFNLLKSQSYDQAFAPIIAFLDEMQVIPAFNASDNLVDFATTVKRNFLTIFSLSQLRLGDKITRTVAGLLYQQIFLFAEQKEAKEQLTVIIDEVSVVEHPLLVRFLAELRKFGVAVILVGQFLEQVSPMLRSAIFANVTNFYLFRTSYQDARILAENIDLPLKGSESIDDKCKFLAGQKLQECTVRLSANGKLYPAFKARTIDFEPPPYIEPEIILEVPTAEVADTGQEEFALDFDSDFTLDDLMQQNTTNRKKLK